MSEIVKNKYSITTSEYSDVWFQSEPGKSLLIKEKQELDKVLPYLFGYYILQCASVPPGDLLTSSKIQHKVIAAPPDAKSPGISPGIICLNSALPIEADSLDVVVLHHVLEFDHQPHQVLREIERVLIGEGHLVLFGFNPWSLFGLWRLFFAWSERYPWVGRYIRLSRLKDWLTLLDFEIVQSEKFYFSPPIRHSRLLSKLRFLEYLGKYCWPFWGGAYLLVAKKRVVARTPIKLQWQSRRRMIASGLIEPNT